MTGDREVTTSDYRNEGRDFGAKLAVLIIERIEEAAAGGYLGDELIDRIAVSIGETITGCGSKMLSVGVDPASLYVFMKAARKRGTRLLGDYSASSRRKAAALESRAAFRIVETSA